MRKIVPPPRRVQAPVGGINPMHELLRQELGIDAFALDGEDGQVVESWADRKRRPPTLVVP